MVICSSRFIHHLGPPLTPFLSTYHFPKDLLELWGLEFRGVDVSPIMVYPTIYDPVHLSGGLWVNHVI